MVNIVYASTFEFDDCTQAVEDILSQIDGKKLLAHSVGIVGCNIDYILSGTIKTLGERLPFEFIGGTTSINSMCGEFGEDQLSLLVLTSDGTSFSCGTTDSLIENPDEKIAATYARVASKLPEEPTMGIVIAPYLPAISGDDQIKALDKASGGIPFFGSVALDYAESMRDPRTICNGENYSECMTMLLLSGKPDPKFFFVAIPENHFLKQKAIITSSEKNILKAVNNMPAASYLESLGLVHEGYFDSIPSIPLSIDIGDGGSPVARAIFAVASEGEIVCGGEMPEGAALGIGSLDSRDVQDTAEKLARDILELGECEGALIFSCLSRNTALGLDTMLEIEKLHSVLGDKLPYLFMYSGGELYPDIVKGKVFNKAHNFTMIACVF